MRARRLATFAIAAAAAIVVLVARPRHIVHLPALVFQGCPGWLFLPLELEVNPNRAANFAANIAAIDNVAHHLARRHVTLVVVVVPDRSRVEAGRLCPLHRPPELDGRYGAIIGSLEQLGIRAIDLRAPLQAAGADTFYRTDTHWNELGARTAAEAVAARLREWGLASRQRAEFRLSTKPPTERVGDLVRLLNDFNGTGTLLRPPGDIEAATVIEQAAPPGIGLLDDVPPPDTVLLGTSYSTVANFAGFLAVALGAPLDNRAKAGGALLGAVRAYLADPALDKAPPRVVLWEMPERILDEPLPAAEREWAQQLESSR
ncbi:MAG: cell division protein FtsQ [Alphaproteobacteria bacterium]|nr:cell division protein FtsQ [Alphaproteobacteria bacterium]